MADASFRSGFAGNEFDQEIDGSQVLHLFGEGRQNYGEPAEALHSPVLVLSRYAALIETVRKAAPRGVPVVQANDLEHAAEKMPSLRPGVLIADTASTVRIAPMVAQLTQQFPNLVVVVAGQREDSVALTQITAYTQIFRFLLVPLSHGQTRLTLEAAIAHHKQLSAPPPKHERSTPAAGESPAAREKKRLVTRHVAYAAGLGAGLALLLGVIGWLVLRTAGEPQAPVTEARTTPRPTNVNRPDRLATELVLAQQAFDRGNYVEPAGESAIDRYRAALNIDPSNSAALGGLRSVADTFLERAGTALIDAKIDDAINAIETARGIDPQHPALAFMEALVVRERLKRSQTSGKRELLAADKGSAPLEAQDARALAATNSPPPDSAGVSLAAAIAPTDASNAGSANLPSRATPKAAPVTKPTKDAGKDLVAEVRRLLSEGKLIDPASENAKEALATLRAADPARAEINELASTLSRRLLESSKQSLATKAFDRSEELLTAARDVDAPGNDAAISQAEGELTAARASASIVPVTKLRRIKMVEPIYPAVARRRGQRGSVELIFTVTPSGSVEDVEVRRAAPARVFDEAAIQAVSQWQFEPVEIDGQTVSQRASARLFFPMK